MATIKSYSDLNQSKVLSKILPLESADMYYMNGTKYVLVIPNYETDLFNLREDDVPCWSLSALLGVLPNYEISNFGDGIQLDVKKEAFVTEGDETLLDLVVNMIIHLHELKML